MRRALVLLVVVVLVGSSMSIANAQGRRGGGQFGGGRQFGFGGGRGGVSPLQVVQRSDVQTELNLSKKQITDIQAIADQARGNRGGGRGRFGQDMTDEERQQAFARMREERQKQQSERTEQVHKLLSAAQKSRLAELTFQLALQRGAAETAAAAAGVELDADAREKLRSAQEEIREKTQEQIAQLQREANMQVLATVMSSAQIQRAKGADFTFEQQQFGRGGGPGGRQRGGQARAGRPQRPTGESSESGGESNTGARRRRR